MPTKTGSDVAVNLQDVSSLSALWEKVQQAPWYAPLIIPAMLIIYKLYSRRKSHILEMAKLETQKHKNILDYKLRIRALNQQAEAEAQPSSGGNE